MAVAAPSAVVWEDVSATALVDGAIPAMEVVTVDTEEDTLDMAGTADMAVADVRRATDVAVATRAGADAGTGDKTPKRTEIGLCVQ